MLGEGQEGGGFSLGRAAVNEDGGGLALRDTAEVPAQVGRYGAISVKMRRIC
ncbi:hypothetical protein ACU4GR_20060 [Methylobacterium oryzae CBMB20]